MIWMCTRAHTLLSFYCRPTFLRFGCPSMIWDIFHKHFDSHFECDESRFIVIYFQVIRSQLILQIRLCTLKRQWPMTPGPMTYLMMPDWWRSPIGQWSSCHPGPQDARHDQCTRNKQNHLGLQNPLWHRKTENTLQDKFRHAYSAENFTRYL